MTKEKKKLENRQSVAYPLLLTGTIKPFSDDVSDRRVEERLQEYESTITRYIVETKANPIVFVENSNYNFNSEKFRKLAESYGKKFEFVKGTISVEQVKQHGIGYGDGLLIFEGLTKSKLLQRVKFFYKVTGRIFIENFDKIVRSAYWHRNEFISYDGIGWCMTWFFKANLIDYLSALGDIYKDCDDKSLRDLEICVWMRLTKSNLKINSFCCYPFTKAKMGDTDKAYISGRNEYMLRNLLIKLHVFTMNSVASKLFWAIYLKISRRKPYITKEKV